MYASDRESLTYLISDMADLYCNGAEEYTEKGSVVKTYLAKFPWLRDELRQEVVDRIESECEEMQVPVD